MRGDGEEQRWFIITATAGNIFVQKTIELGLTIEMGWWWLAMVQ